MLKSQSNQAYCYPITMSKYMGGFHSRPLIYCVDDILRCYRQPYADLEFLKKHKNRIYQQKIFRLYVRGCSEYSGCYSHVNVFRFKSDTLSEQYYYGRTSSVLYKDEVTLKANSRTCSALSFKTYKSQDFDSSKDFDEDNYDDI